MKLKSPAFAPDGVIPEKFSQNDANRSVPLEFAGVPHGTKSLALIMDDPDAPGGTFTHWVVFNIDPNTDGFAENKVPRDVHRGLNNYNQPDYAGPKPPDGEHRYFFHLYALITRLDLPHNATRDELEHAMTGRIIAAATLMGRYAAPLATR